MLGRGEERGFPFMTSALRGEGVSPKADIALELSEGGCVNLRTRGEGGPKSQKFCGRHKWTPPKAKRIFIPDSDSTVRGRFLFCHAALMKFLRRPL